MSDASPTDIINEFDHLLDEIVALYLDTEAGIRKWYEFLLESQRQTHLSQGYSLGDSDRGRFLYSKGNPNHLETKM